MTARVRDVSAVRTPSGSMLNVPGRMSTNTGVAPTLLIQPAVAKNEYVVVTTSSPRTDAERHQHGEERIGAGRNGYRVARLQRAAEFGLELLDLGAEDEPLAIADAFDGGEQLAAKRPVLRLEIEQRNGGRRTIRTAQ